MTKNKNFFKKLFVAKQGLHPDCENFTLLHFKKLD